MTTADSAMESAAPATENRATLASLGISVVRDDVAFRLQRRLGLIPANGLGIARRALFWSLFAWLPIAAWAVWNGSALANAAGEPLLAHFGIHARFLLAIPLLFIGEATVHGMSLRVLPQFVTTGLVPAEEVAGLQQLVQRLARLRDAVLPWIAMLAIVVAVITVSQVLHRVHEVEWAEAPGPAPVPGFGGWWFLYVARPIFLTLMLAWLWRIVLLFLLFRGIARLKLSIVPTHPDRTGGLGFLARFPAAFAPIVLALSAVTAAMLAHDVVYHGASVGSLKIQMAVFVLLVVLIFLLPMLAFVAPLARARRQALADYGALVGRHGRLVHRRWIEGKAVPEQSLLDAPELGPIADVATLFDAVRAMRTVPLSKDAVMPLVLAAVVPMIVVFAIEVPIGQLLGQILKTLR